MSGFLAVLAGPTARQALATTLLSPDTTGAAAGGVVFNINPGSPDDVSPDGRFIVFTSTANDLVAGVSDTNGVADVFLRDVQAGTTAILSVDASGNAIGSAGNTFLSGFVFSPDSTRLIFRTQATGIIAGLADTNNAPDWFVRDLLAGTTSCVTVNAAGTSTGNVTSFTLEPPVFSPDGSLLAFISLAGDLVAGVTDPAGRDLFLRDLEAETTSLISVATNGNAAGSTTDDPAQFSPDGRYLAFLSLAPNLVDGVSDTNNFTDLFVRDLQTDTTVLVTRTVDDQAATFSSAYEWALDGHAILFASNGTNLVAGVTDTNFLDDLFVWKTDTHEISLVSGSPDGTAAGDKASRSFGVSPNSRFVAFASASTNLTPESAGGDVKADLYVRDLQTDTTTYVARNATSSVVFGLARFSPDQMHLLFASSANDVVPGIADTNGQPDLFLYDLQGGDTSVVTINAQGTATGNTTGTSIDDVVLSPNGRYVSFVSAATDLVANFTTTSTRDLFVRDLVAGVTSLVTVFISGGGAGYDQGATRDAEFSPNSRFLVFTTNSFLATPVTTAFNFNFATNLYAYDVVDQALHLLTTNAAGTAPANAGGPFEGGVEPFSFIANPAGGSVFFLSTFTDMVAGVTDTAHTLDLFLAPLPAVEPPEECGDPVPDGALAAGRPEGPRLVRASDALYMLRAAVGSGTCELCVCDVDGNGSVAATDALITLKIAVGQPLTLQCPAC
jgi:Tol biopolymer transport system component